MVGSLKLAVWPRTRLERHVNKSLAPPRPLAAVHMRCVIAFKVKSAIIEGFSGGFVVELALSRGRADIDLFGLSSCHRVLPGSNSEIHETMQ